MKLALRVAPLVLLIWLFFLFGFKTELNYYGDEPGYDFGGKLLAHSLAKGTFIDDALDTNLFKYPGYYAFAGIVYFLFGEHPLLLRALGFLPFVGLALIVANISTLIAGERARSFALLAVLFSPVFLFFSLQIYRDIYIVFYIAIVFHRVVAVTQLGFHPVKYITPFTAVAFLLIFLFRAPQMFTTAAIVGGTLIFCITLTLPVWKRLIIVLLFLILLIVVIYLNYGLIIEVINEIFFNHFKIDGQLTLNQYAAISDFSFTSTDEMLSAFLNPIFVVKALILKVTGFVFNANPFVQTDSDILTLFGKFEYGYWGGYQWEDVLLVYGLQWIPHFVLQPFLIAGIVGLCRFNHKALIALVMMWVIHALITLFTANEIRWGLPMMLVYYVVLSTGYAWFAGRIMLMMICSYILLTLVILVRIWIFPVPMILVPLALVGVMLLTKPKPVVMVNN